MKAIAQAFDAAWESIAVHFGDDPKVIEDAGRPLMRRAMPLRARCTIIARSVPSARHYRLRHYPTLSSLALAIRSCVASGSQAALGNET